MVEKLKHILENMIVPELGIPVGCGQGMQVMFCMTNEIVRDDLYFLIE